MIRRNIEFPYVHDLEQLRRVLQEKGEDIPEGLWASRQLSRFAWTDRYPSRAPSPTEKEYREYVALAEEVVRWAEDRIS